jgi:hypothetical protein
MKAQNEKKTSVSLRIKFSLRWPYEKSSWLTWVEIAVSVVAIAVHVISLRT